MPKMSWLSTLQRSWQQHQHQQWLAKHDTDGSIAKLCEPLFAKPKPNQWVAIDCEMTGLNPKHDHLLSIAAIHINGNDIESGQGLHLVCRPPKMPTAETIIIHGLRPLDVMHGLSYNAMLATLIPFIGSRPVVGFCPQIDFGFINRLLKAHCGMALMNDAIDIRQLHAKRQGMAHEGILHQGQSFASIMHALDIPELPSHDAYNDALMTAMAFLVMK